MIRQPRRSTLFPYTTLSRSEQGRGQAREARADDGHVHVHVAGDRAVIVWRSSRRADPVGGRIARAVARVGGHQDRKSTRLNSSHLVISYAVFCLKKKNEKLRLVKGEFKDGRRTFLMTRPLHTDDKDADGQLETGKYIRKVFLSWLCHNGDARVKM